MEHKISSPYLTVTVSELGAELRSIKDADGTEYLWQGDPAYWSDRAPNIFPYVARLTKGSYYLDGKLFEMKPHGFALGECFKVISKKDNELVLELTDREVTYEQYPRRFSLRVKYIVDGATLKIIFSVTNRDERTMYFGIGGHPGFNVPLTAELEFDDYYLEFDGECSPKRIGFTPTCYLNGERADFPLEDGRIIKLSHGIFSDDAIVLTDVSDKVTLKTAKDSRSVTVSYPKMKFLGIWHRPNTDAPYVCIEPWSSLPSTQDLISVFEAQKDLVTLEPDKTEDFPWEITVKY
ncbi:MAG: aldose 1-epimerase family protein [Clostridia bacterium]|nr:aldose 1-epimerase family protein [Clostridia bacterium]